MGINANIEAKIPEKETANLLSSITDCIRPFSEKRGLKADQIRLQREDVLYEIAKKARKRADLDHPDCKPIPNKTLVPLLEKASLEEMDDDEMQERWASLILSESVEHHSRNLTFVDILSRLSSNELTILEDVCLSYERFPELSYPDDHIDDNKKIILSKLDTLNADISKPLSKIEINELQNISKEDRPKLINKGKIAEETYENFLNSQEIKSLQYAGVLYATVKLPFGETYYYYTNFHAQHESLEILKKEQLIDFESINQDGRKVGYFNVTRLGVNFVNTCCPIEKRKYKND